MISKINADLKSAMLARDEVRVSTLRLLKAALTNAEIANKEPLDDSQAITVLQRELKQRLESAESYEKAGSADRSAKEKQEADIIANYLPSKLGEDEVNQLVEAAIADTTAETMADMGKVMAWLKPKTTGRVDGAQLAAIVKTKLSSK